MERRKLDPTADERIIARRLAAVADMPFVHAVHTVRLLRRLRLRIDLDEITKLLDVDAESAPIGLPVDELDLVQMCRFLELADEVTGGSAASAPDNEIRVVLAAIIDGIDIVYEHVLAGRIFPHGTWSFDPTEFAVAVDHARRDRFRTLAVRAARDLSMPHPPLGGTGEPARVAIDRILPGADGPTRQIVAGFVRSLTADDVDPIDDVCVTSFVHRRSSWWAIDLEDGRFVWWRSTNCS